MWLWLPHWTTEIQNGSLCHCRKSCGTCCFQVARQRVSTLTRHYSKPGVQHPRDFQRVSGTRTILGGYMKAGPAWGWHKGEEGGTFSYSRHLPGDSYVPVEGGLYNDPMRATARVSLCFWEEETSLKCTGAGKKGGRALRATENRSWDSPSQAEAAGVWMRRGEHFCLCNSALWASVCMCCAYVWYSRMVFKRTP